MRKADKKRPHVIKGMRMFFTLPRQHAAAHRARLSVMNISC